MTRKHLGLPAWRNRLRLSTSSRNKQIHAPLENLTSIAAGVFKGLPLPDMDTRKISINFMAGVLNDIDTYISAICQTLGINAPVSYLSLLHDDMPLCDYGLAFYPDKNGQPCAGLSDFSEPYEIDFQEIPFSEGLKQLAHIYYDSLGTKEKLKLDDMIGDIDTPYHARLFEEELLNIILEHEQELRAKVSLKDQYNKKLNAIRECYTGWNNHYLYLRGAHLTERRSEHHVVYDLKVGRQVIQSYYYDLEADTPPEILKVRRQNISASERISSNDGIDISFDEWAQDIAHELGLYYTRQRGLENQTASLG
jgi:hypothetical protein